MSRLVAALALSFPLCANADLVQLEYEGVVTSVSRSICDCDPTRGFAKDNPEYTGYSVGDRLHGFLSIDLASAPPDRYPLEPAVGIYPTAQFIGGNGPSFRLDGASVVDFREDQPFEHYAISDQWRLPNGLGQMGIVVVSRKAGLDLVVGDGLEQNFDARPGGGLELFGYLNKAVKTAKGSIALQLGLLFDRVRVTSPGRCKA
jgi:hypothetical protein